MQGLPIRKQSLQSSHVYTNTNKSWHSYFLTNFIVKFIYWLWQGWLISLFSSLKLWNNIFLTGFSSVGSLEQSGHLQLSQFINITGNLKKLSHSKLWSLGDCFILFLKTFIACWTGQSLVIYLCFIFNLICQFP